MEGNKPERKFRAGAVSVTVWRNHTEKGDFSSVQVDKSYKDKEGNWQKTNSLNVGDLPKAITALQEAYRHLTLKDAELPIEAVV